MNHRECPDSTQAENKYKIQQARQNSGILWSEVSDRNQLARADRQITTCKTGKRKREGESAHAHKLSPPEDGQDSSANMWHKPVTQHTRVQTMHICYILWHDIHTKLHKNQFLQALLMADKHKRHYYTISLTFLIQNWKYGKCCLIQSLNDILLYNSIYLHYVQLIFVPCSARYEELQEFSVSHFSTPSVLQHCQKVSQYHLSKTGQDCWSSSLLLHRSQPFCCLCFLHNNAVLTFCICNTTQWHVYFIHMCNDSIYLAKSLVYHISLPVNIKLSVLTNLLSCVLYTEDCIPTALLHTLFSYSN
jgi:hypothetical protein